MEVITLLYNAGLYSVCGRKTKSHLLVNILVVWNNTQCYTIMFKYAITVLYCRGSDNFTADSFCCSKLSRVLLDAADVSVFYITY